MPRKIALLLLACCLLLIGYVGVIYLLAPPVVEAEYQDYASARTGDEVRDHWLPDFVPDSATSIHVRYGVDPSFLELEFLYDQQDLNQITANFAQIVDTSKARTILENLNGRRWNRRIGDKVLVFAPASKSESGETHHLVLDPIDGSAWYCVD